MSGDARGAARRGFDAAVRAGLRLAFPALKAWWWVTHPTIEGVYVAVRHDGDVLLAWRLFLQYRQLFGDDYNFCLWFGDFAADAGEYRCISIGLDRRRSVIGRKNVSADRNGYFNGYGRSGTYFRFEGSAGLAGTTTGENCDANQGQNGDL